MTDLLTPKVEGGEAPQKWFRRWCQTTDWHRAVLSALKPLGLSPTQFYLLEVIERLESRTAEGTKQQTLCDITTLDKSTVSYAVRRLAERQLVDRSGDGLDARAWSVRVTTLGMKDLRRARPLVERATSDFMAAFREIE
ncbi:MAG: hypothetical protein RJA70_347 [Pseudomonadota bacterium]|jgi:DNA-binding MarR family transcriptional regulator